MIRPIAPMMEYIVNADYIAEFLCVNKDKKELRCKGKCYLMEQLKNRNGNKKHNLPKITLEEYPIGFVTIASVKTSFEDISVQKHIQNYFNGYRYLFCANSFHPPNTISYHS